VLKSQNDGHGFGDYGNAVDIRREYMLDDAFENIYNKNFNMKKHLKIRFIDETN
jgi:hypothetical protein